MAGGAPRDRRRRLDQGRQEGQRRRRASTLTEALDVALCFGWIDGQRKPFDETYFLQKYTPRRARSKWSKRNVGQGGEADRGGEMRPAGLAEVERAQGRRALGRCLRLAGEHPGTAGPAGRARRRPGGGVLRDAQLDQPLRDPLPAPRRQEARDAGAAARAVRRRCSSAARRCTSYGNPASWFECAQTAQRWPVMLTVPSSGHSHTNSGRGSPRRSSCPPRAAELAEVGQEGSGWVGGA